MGSAIVCLFLAYRPGNPPIRRLFRGFMLRWLAMTHKLAFMTLGILRKPFGNAEVQGFVDRVPGVYGAADASDGFHARSIRDLKTYLHSWGEVSLPEWYPGREEAVHDQVAVTLSLWEDLESVAAFSYHGAHGEALTKRREWFDKVNVPVYVAWWVDADHAITFEEGYERIESLHREGPTAFAFDFGKPFDASGNSCVLDRAAVKQKAATNAEAPTMSPS